MHLEFHKYHGLGNDFAVIDARALNLSLAGSLGQHLCDRHRGIGADGLLLWTGTAEKPVMTVINADGSVADMCGNGLRCFVKHLLDRHLRHADALEVATGSGNLACQVTRDASGLVDSVAVEMGRAVYDPALIPVQNGGILQESPLTVHGVTARWTALKLGNPHAVTFDPLSVRDRQLLGPLLEQHELFPAKANIEFAQILPGDKPQIELHVFERGCGWTQACGTGATATALVAVDSGKLPRGQEISVHLPGGWLGITVAEDGMATMRGPAVEVYAGMIDVTHLLG